MKTSKLLSILAAGVIPALAFADTQTYSFTAADLGFIKGKAASTITVNADGSEYFASTTTSELLVGYLPAADIQTNYLSTVGNSVTLTLNVSQVVGTGGNYSVRVGFFDAAGDNIVAVGTAGNHAGDNNAPATDDLGYFWNLSAGLGGSSASFYGRNTSGTSSNLSGSTGVPTYSVNGSVSSTGNSSFAAFSTGTPYTISVTYTKLSNGIGIVGVLSDGTNNFIVKASDPTTSGTTTTATASENLVNPTEVTLRFGSPNLFTTMTISGGTVTYTSIPEPATYAACLGALSLVIVGYRRMRARR